MLIFPSVLSPFPTNWAMESVVVLLVVVVVLIVESTGIWVAFASFCSIEEGIGVEE
jgi:xanthine/uracil permease